MFSDPVRRYSDFFALLSSLVAFVVLSIPAATQEAHASGEFLLCAPEDRNDPEMARPGSELRVRDECLNDEVAVEGSLALCAALAERGGEKPRQGARVRIASACRDSRQARIATLASSTAGGSLGGSEPRVKPIIFDLDSGVATVTGPFPDSTGACGQNEASIEKNYPGFVMAAVPSAFFSQYMPNTGNVKCDSDRKVATDLEGRALCFELTKGSISQKVIVADKCAGDCSGNVIQCQTAEPYASCAVPQGTASCLDCPDPSIQFQAKWRCPPAMDCFRDHNPGESWKDWTSSFIASTLGINVDSECDVSGYMPSGDYPAHVDWCSGENAHFDIQPGNPFDALSNPTVVSYQRIDCSS